VSEIGSFDEVRDDGLRYVRHAESEWQVTWLVSNGRAAVQLMMMRLPLGHPGSDEEERLRRAFADMQGYRDEAVFDFGLHLPPGGGGVPRDQCDYIDEGACSFHPSFSYATTFLDKMKAYLDEHETADREDAIYALLVESLEHMTQ
jgi:hypothetical protein